MLSINSFGIIYFIIRMKKKNKTQQTDNQMAYSCVVDMLGKNTYEPRVSCLFFSSIKVILNCPK